VSVQSSTNLNSSIRGNLRIAIHIEVKNLVGIVIHVVDVVVTMRGITNRAPLFAFVVQSQAEASIEVLCSWRPRGNIYAGAIS
jgi:hypothetical protein